MAAHLTLRTIALFGIGAAVTLLGTMLFFDVDEQVLLMLQWIDTQGALALVWFVLIMTLVVVLILPGALFTIGAGFIFGVVQGIVGVLIGTTVGAVLAFLMARYVFGSRIQAYIMSHSRLQLVSYRISTNGFKVVLLTRLVPFFPGKLSNYFFGLTEVSLRDYALASGMGFIPFSLHNVYLGSIAADIATLGSRNTDRSAIEWSIYGAGFALTVFVALSLNKIAKRLLVKDLRKKNTSQSSR